MRFNKLGNTDIQLSVIGLGTYAIGGGDYPFGWGPQDDKESIDTISQALELGINWIDTAPIYGMGRSEEVVGKAIKVVRDTVILSTKCGLWMTEKKDDLLFNLKRDSIRSEVEASLKRLHTDVIDLYQIHRPIPEEDVDEAWETLNDLKKEGKIRYAGVSTFTKEQLKRVHAIHPIAFHQPEYSMLEPFIEGDILDYCAANKIGVIVYSTMYSGLLTGKFTKDRITTLPGDDLRHLLDHFKEPFLSANLQLVEKLRVIAQRNNRTVAHLAIAWTLRRPEVTSAIVGARRPSQIEQTAPAVDWVLSEPDKSELDKILNEHHTLLKKLKDEKPNA